MSTSEARTHTLTGTRGNRLHVTEVLPTGSGLGTIVLVHGYGEHSGRYMDVADQMAARGYRVVMPDVRGHGRSQGDRGFVERFDDYVADLEIVLASTRTPPTQLALVGHSNGGLIAAAWLTRGGQGVKCAALTSPFLGIRLQPPKWKIAAGHAMSALWPRFSLPSEILAADLTHDENQVRRYETDPLVHHVANSRWFTEATRTHRKVTDHASNVRVPTLVMQAADDRLVDPEMSRAWAARVPGATFEMVPDRFHELMFETDGPTHVRRVLDWVDHHLRPNT
jgi:alpha-beta hydrolase superfamily lysophospholipase